VYSDDLAYIHHRGFTRLAAKVSAELMRLLRQHGIRGAAHRAPTIVEVGCGSGVLAARLDAAGYDVVGIDRSAAMIRLARATAPGARLRVARLERARLPRASAVIALGEIVTYVPGGLPALREFFTRVRRSLRPGGLFVFDFIESAERRTYRRRVMEGDDWRIVLRATTDPTGRILTRRMALTRLVAGRARRSTETHRVRIYSREEMGAALTAVGFRFEMRRFAAYRRIPGDLVVVASVSARMPP
jgi:SAM-dependent methyltransferase